MVVIQVTMRAAGWRNTGPKCCLQAKWPAMQMILVAICFHTNDDPDSECPPDRIAMAFVTSGDIYTPSWYRGFHLFFLPFIGLSDAPNNVRPRGASFHFG